MKKLCAIIIVMLSLFSLVSFATVKAAPDEAYYISTNPSEDLATGVNISWHSDVEGSFVEYTLASDTTYSQKKQVQGTCTPFSKEANEGGFLTDGFALRNTCYAELRDLSPNTEYMYRVGKTTFSKNYYFKTAINSSSFSFIHITDPQYGNLTQAGIFNGLMTQAYNINPNIGFTFFTGDIVDRGGRESLWSYFFQQSNISRNIIATGPGNHEYYDNSSSPKTWDASYYNAFYRNPQNGPAAIMNSSYYFRYNNALFIMIDSEHKNQTANTVWFKKVVEENMDADFVIVGMHRSFYGSIYAEHSVQVRATWQQIFDRYGVDLVLSGHDHIYARSHSIYNNAISGDPIRGTTYIIGGFGGAKYYAAKANEKYAKVIEQTSCANIITVDQNKISINLINTAGTTIDTAVIPKKRLGTQSENFDKESFLESILVEVSPNVKSTATVTWSSSAYKNVAGVQVINNQYGFTIADTHMYNSSLNTLVFSGIKQKVLNEYTIKVLFADGSISEVPCVIDNREPEVIVHLRLADALSMIKEMLIEELGKIFN